VTLPGECNLGDGLYIVDAAGDPAAFASSGNREDALLIAAAPDLLDACLSALGTLHGRKETICVVVSLELKAAIAKTRGEV